jgi:hypothetical protein
MADDPPVNELSDDPQQASAGSADEDKHAVVDGGGTAWKQFAAKLLLWLRERLETGTESVGLGLFLWGLIAGFIVVCIVAPWILFAVSPVPSLGPAFYYGYLGVVVLLSTWAGLTFAFDRSLWQSRADRSLYVVVEVLLLAGLVLAFAAVYLKLQRTTGCVQSPQVTIKKKIVPEHFSQFDAVYFTITTFTTVGSNAFTVLSEPCRVLVSVQTVTGLALIGGGIAATVGHLTRRTTDARVSARAWELRKEIQDEGAVTTRIVADIDGLLRDARDARTRDPVLKRLALDGDATQPKRIALTKDGARVLLRQIEVAMTGMWLEGRLWNLTATLGTGEPPPQALQAYSALRDEGLRKRALASKLRVPRARDATKKIEELPDAKDKALGTEEFATCVKNLEEILENSAVFG